MKRILFGLGLSILATVTILAYSLRSDAQAQSSDAAANSPAVQRARKTVKMLDDIYKTAVVLITDKYVHNEDDFPAGSAAVALFDAISKKGWHKVRLIDATGEPYEAKNVAQDEFEKEGIRQLKSGKDYYEQQVTIDGKPMLRAITPIPVVMQKCVMCHEHYADAKEGEPIGAISYTLTIE